MREGSSRRGGERGEHAQTGPDGWATIGNSAPRPPPKAGDRSNFGKISKMASMTFGPNSIFARKETKWESRGSMNMFSMLAQNAELAVESAASSKSSRALRQKASIPLGQSDVSEASAQRRTLNLLLRTVFKSDMAQADAMPVVSTVNSDDEE
ncbi:hypothetical protein A0H81_10244 [Grifola frondosa]|uniref:Uncharacterized protein n=1 Tax=Grifola frondosa TaxID=5627 RepID=A0A1C7LY17_GRIFR|nr:hypothetical protein A0H81_10244 [Grifola frondosa]